MQTEYVPGGGHETAGVLPLSSSYRVTAPGRVAYYTGPPPASFLCCSLGFFANIRSSIILRCAAILYTDLFLFLFCPVNIQTHKLN